MPDVCKCHRWLLALIRCQITVLRSDEITYCSHSAINAVIIWFFWLLPVLSRHSQWWWCQGSHTDTSTSVLLLGLGGHSSSSGVVDEPELMGASCWHSSAWDGCSGQLLKTVNDLCSMQQMSCGWNYIIHTSV
jgi:hypothetical protein